MKPETPILRLLCRILRGEPIFSGDLLRLGMDASFRNAFLDESEAHEIAPLLFYALSRTPEWPQWPLEIRQALEDEYRYQSMHQLSMRSDLINVLNFLDQARIRPILLKGSGLSYLIYPQPQLRPFYDIDLLIDADEFERVREEMLKNGYTLRNAVVGKWVSHEATFLKTDSVGREWAYDFHWKISNPVLFSDLLTKRELSAQALNVPSFEVCARMTGLGHALFLACIHRAAHHAGDNRLIWIYDIHLLLEQMDLPQLKSFTELARLKKVSALCLEGLESAAAHFKTRVPHETLETLRIYAKNFEPSADYLNLTPKRARDFRSNWNALPLARDKMNYLEELLFPPAAYMLQKYNTRHSLLLPFLYLRRGIEGLSKFWH